MKWFIRKLMEKRFGDIRIFRIISPEVWINAETLLLVKFDFYFNFPFFLLQLLVYFIACLMYFLSVVLPFNCAIVSIWHQNDTCTRSTGIRPTLEYHQPKSRQLQDSIGYHSILLFHDIHYYLYFMPTMSPDRHPHNACTDIRSISPDCQWPSTR